MTNFKISDRVRYVHQTGGSTPDLPLGSTGTIHEIYGGGRYPYSVLSDSGRSEAFAADELELVHPIARTHAVRP